MYQVFERLRDSSLKVRRIAAMDAARVDVEGLLDQELEEWCEGLLARMGIEDDVRVFVRVIQALGEAGTELVRREKQATWHKVLKQLHGLMDEPGTDIEVYHAALLARDGIEVAGRGLKRSV